MSELVPEVIAITLEAQERIAGAPTAGGDLWFGHSKLDRLYVATRIESRPHTFLPITDLKDVTAFARAQRADVRGQWLGDVPADAHVLHATLLRRPGVSVERAVLAQVVHTLRTSRDSFPLVTRSRDLPQELAALGVAEYAGWNVTGDTVTAIPIALEPAAQGIVRLQDQWPVATLQEARVAVVGVGSIGSTIANSLAASGVGRLDLVDPDRYLWHNTVRHILGLDQVGRLKVDALRDLIEERWPCTVVRAHPWDVVERADLLRGLLTDVDLVVCAADGIAPRRTVSHLIRRANVPAVLCCVLDDGAIGEVLRFRPGPHHGCLLCQRDQLQRAGAIDAEADQERDYGTGLVHKPMTAVGPDLWFVAEVAAKVATSTLLEQAGHGEHRLPGEYAVVSLRAGTDLATPFDAPQSATTTWWPATPPRPDCPTCNPKR
jgi:hypothetical protein